MEAQKNQPFLTLNNGVVIPQFGLGVYSIPAGEATLASLNQEKRFFNMTYQQIKDWMENYELWD